MRPYAGEEAEGYTQHHMVKRGSREWVKVDTVLQLYV